MVQVFKDIQYTRKSQYRVRIKDLNGEMKLIGYYAQESEAEAVIKALNKAEDLIFLKRLL